MCVCVLLALKLCCGSNHNISDVCKYVNLIYSSCSTDTPGPVESMEVTDITMVSCKLSWSPPTSDGGSEVTHYIVEKREIDRKTWATVSSNVEVDKATLKISNLVPGTEYYFRVIAVNEYGPGVAKVSSKAYLASDPISKCFVV